MRRILVLSEIYWPEKGGAELATHLILNLLKKDYDITVVTGTEQPERLEGLRYVYSKLLDTPNKIQLWRNIGILRNTNWFINLVKQADIVYIPRCSYPVIPLAKKHDKKVIVHLHNYQPITHCSIVLNGEDGFGVLQEFSRSLRFEVLENRSIRKALLSPLVSPLNRLVRYWNVEADEVICVSKRQREIIASAMPELANKLRVIYNLPLHVPLIEKRPEDPVFIYLGGDSYAKGFHVFLEASQRLLKRESHLRFLLAGSFKNKSKLMVEKISKRFGGAYNVLGRLEHRAILNLCFVAYALVFPSICEEPFPYAVLEAMLSRTIPIASKVGGVPEIVQGTYAEKMMFTPGDVEESVRRIEEVLSLSEESLIDIGASLRENILKKFDVNMIRDQLLNILSESS